MNLTKPRETQARTAKTNAPRPRTFSALITGANARSRDRVVILTGSLISLRNTLYSCIYLPITRRRINFTGAKSERVMKNADQEQSTERRRDARAGKRKTPPETMISKAYTRALTTRFFALLPLLKQFSPWCVDFSKKKQRRESAC